MADRRMSFYEPGWRDLACPICDAKWFVRLSRHLRVSHGLNRAEQRLLGVRLVSEDHVAVHRELRLERMAEGRQIYPPGREPELRRARWASWGSDIRSERRAGGDFTRRLAARWGVNRETARRRVNYMIEQGVVPPSGRAHLRSETCAAGHKRTKRNTYLPPGGGRQCRRCNAIAAANRRARRA